MTTDTTESASLVAAANPNRPLVGRFKGDGTIEIVVHPSHPRYLAVCQFVAAQLQQATLQEQASDRPGQPAATC
jgi:hypothetical protein